MTDIIIMPSKYQITMTESHRIERASWHTVALNIHLTARPEVQAERKGITMEQLALHSAVHSKMLPVPPWAHIIQTDNLTLSQVRDKVVDTMHRNLLLK